LRNIVIPSSSSRITTLTGSVSSWEFVCWIKRAFAWR